MAINTYATLKSAVADYLNRDDLTSVIPTFISLAEAKFNRELRVRDMLTRATASSSNEYVPVPDDYLQHQSLEMVTAQAAPPLDYISPDEAKRRKANHIVVGIGTTFAYTVIDGSFEIIPAPTSSTDYSIVYYAKIPALTDSNTTNWLLTKSPDLYLYSALLEASPYLKDDDRVQIWGTARQQVMDAMMLESERSMRSSTQLTMRRRGF